MILLTDEQLGEVAQELEIGMVCYVHQQTCELIVFPNPEQFTFGDTGDWQESIDTVEASPDDYWAIHPMTSFESFQVIERFVEVLPANHLRTRLITILNQPKPFRHFKQAVDESYYRENWFAFRDGEMAQWRNGTLAQAEIGKYERLKGRMTWLNSNKTTFLIAGFLTGPN